MDTPVKAHKATFENPRLANVSIRAAEPVDAAEISVLMGSEGTFEGTLQMPYAAAASRIDMLSKTDTQSVRLVAVHRDADSHTQRIVAHAGLFTLHASLRRIHVRGLGITVAKDWQGHGLGDRLVHSLLDWADHWAGVLRIELTVFTDNARAVALYQRHGFVQEGVLRAYALREGVYADAFAMARLHPKPPVLPQV
jgi:L-phenylalanine/L-methionine N-acetyltransferase